MKGKGSVVREGLLLGVIGYAAVALFFAFFDLLAGRGATFTLNLLGHIVFRGVRDPAVLQTPLPPDLGAMLSYTYLHLGLALAVGFLVSWLVHRVERQPRLAVPVAAFLVAGYLVTISAVRAYTLNAAPLLPFGSIVVVNTLVALAGGVYLWQAHPGLWDRARTGSDDSVDRLAGL